MFPSPKDNSRINSFSKNQSPIIIQKCEPIDHVDNLLASNDRILSDEVFRQAEERAKMLISIHKINAQATSIVHKDVDKEKHLTEETPDKVKTQPAKKVTSVQKESVNLDIEMKNLLFQVRKLEWQLNGLIDDIRKGTWTHTIKKDELEDEFVLRKKRQTEEFFIRISRKIYNIKNEVNSIENQFKRSKINSEKKKLLKKLSSKYGEISKVIQDAKSYQQWHWLRKDSFIQLFMQLLNLLEQINLISISTDIKLSESYLDAIKSLKNELNILLVKLNEGSQPKKKQIASDKKIKVKAKNDMKKPKIYPVSERFRRKITVDEKKIEANRRNLLAGSSHKPVMKLRQNSYIASCRPAKTQTVLKPIQVEASNQVNILQECFKSISDNLKAINHELKVKKENDKASSRNQADNKIQVTTDSNLQKPPINPTNEVTVETSKGLLMQDILSRLKNIEVEEEKIKERWNNVNYEETRRSADTQILPRQSPKTVVLTKSSPQPKDIYDILNLKQTEISISPDKLVSLKCYANKFNKFHSLNSQFKGHPISEKTLNKLCEEIVGNIIEDVTEEISQFSPQIIQDIFDAEFKENQPF